MTKEQEDFAAANAQAFLDAIEAEEKANTDLEKQQATTVAVTEEPLLSDGVEPVPGLTVDTSVGEVRSASPSSPSVKLTVASPYSVRSSTDHVEEQAQVAETPEDVVAVMYPEAALLRISLKSPCETWKSTRHTRKTISMVSSEYRFLL